uniref:Uncharacterized protein n=1 Tax=Anguilla anguilla TaxID=7936 RepID=A0A0E9UTX9_ANGAN
MYGYYGAEMTYGYTKSRRCRTLHDCQTPCTAVLISDAIKER